MVLRSERPTQLPGERSMRGWREPALGLAARRGVAAHGEGVLRPSSGRQARAAPRPDHQARPVKNAATSALLRGTYVTPERCPAAWAAAAESGSKSAVRGEMRATGLLRSRVARNSGSARILPGSRRSAWMNAVALWPESAGHQRSRVRHDDGVVVHVDNPGLWGGVLGDLVGVARGWDAGADVKELPDARLSDQVADGAAEKGAVGAGRGPRRWHRRDDVIAKHPVGGVVVAFTPSQ